MKMLQELFEATDSGTIEWSATSNPFEFSTYYLGIRYSIERVFGNELDSQFSFFQWDNTGDPKQIAIDEQYLALAQSLFEAILKKNESLNIRFNTFLKKMNDEIEKKNRNTSVSLHKVMTRLGYESEVERPYISIFKTKYFYYKDEDTDNFIQKYVQPPMSQIPTTEGMVPYNEAEVILISAPGATGKSAMAEYISFMLRIPILNLGEHDAVGANSISGLIMTQVEKKDVFLYHDGLGSGMCSMIIDGLDEASIHITQDSFEAFLKDVAFFAKGSKGLPFVILGRPSVMEDAALALEENNIKVSLLQIEPFTVEKAVRFIDNQLPRDYILRYQQQYKDVRDYIIDQIGGFFKNESELNKKLFEHFIGYAPVLQSISNLLTDEKDYHHLLAELHANSKQKIDLLIDIVQRILVRERKKIITEVLPQLFDNNHSDAFKNSIIEKCGNEDDQCLRILGRLSGREYVDKISGDEYFDEKYNSKVNEWIKNHPFLEGGKKKIQNIVFESYLTAKLINKEDVQDDVLVYLDKTNSCSYLLLDIYTTLYKDTVQTISHHFFPFLYGSFKALDHPQDIGNTEIIADEVDEKKCYLNFCRKELECEYDFIFWVKDNDCLLVPSPISSINIDAPITVAIEERKVDIQSPSSITCKSLMIKSKDILFSSYSSSHGSIVFECQKFTAQCDDGTMPSLLFRTPKENNNFILITNDKVFHPFNNFLHPIEVGLSTEGRIYEAYQKLRRMILMFRSHNKGSLARCCSKIDNRIGRTELGKTIIDELKNSDVIFSDGTLYYINSNKFAEVLGLKYDDIRSSDINEKTRLFLQRVIKTLS